MNRYLEINDENVVVNIIIWDGIAPYDSQNHTLVLCGDAPMATFGWKFVNGEWAAPVINEVEE